MQAILLCALNLGACCILTFLYKKPADEEPPLCIKIVGIRWVGTLLCRRCGCCRKNKVKPDTKPEEKEAQVLQVEDAENKKDPLVTPNETEPAKETAALEEKAEKKSEDSERAETWQEFADIMNIIFSILYGVASVVILIFSFVL